MWNHVKVSRGNKFYLYCLLYLKDNKNPCIKNQ